MEIGMEMGMQMEMEIEIAGIEIEIENGNCPKSPVHENASASETACGGTSCEI